MTCRSTTARQAGNANTLLKRLVAKVRGYRLHGDDTLVPMLEPIEGRTDTVPWLGGVSQHGWLRVIISAVELEAGASTSIHAGDPGARAMRGSGIFLAGRTRYSGRYPVFEIAPELANKTSFTCPVLKPTQAPSKLPLTPLVRSSCTKDNGSQLRMTVLREGAPITE